MLGSWQQQRVTVRHGPVVSSPQRALLLYPQLFCHFSLRGPAFPSLYLSSNTLMQNRRQDPAAGPAAQSGKPLYPFLVSLVDHGLGARNDTASGPRACKWDCSAPNPSLVPSCWRVAGVFLVVLPTLVIILPFAHGFASFFFFAIFFFERVRFLTDAHTLLSPLFPLFLTLSVPLLVGFGSVTTLRTINNNAGYTSAHTVAKPCCFTVFAGCSDPKS